MTVRWVAACSKCGKVGQIVSVVNRPTGSPNMISGKCPSSSDGKHKPKWQKD